MIINSNVVMLNKIVLPKFEGLQLYMHKVSPNKINLPNGFKKYKKIIESMLSMIPNFLDEMYVTIDEKFLQKGNSHRRSGPHTDGNYIYGWGGGGGWLTGENGRHLSREKHVHQYLSNTGGMLIASDYSSCKAWKGNIEGEPNQGGDCSHLIEKLNNLDSLFLEKNTVYFMNSTAIHESLPVDENVHRNLIRITLPSNFQGDF